MERRTSQLRSQRSFPSSLRSKNSIGGGDDHRNQSATSDLPASRSYYDLYPERKAKGPYVPRPSLLAPPPRQRNRRKTINVDDHVEELDIANKFQQSSGDQGTSRRWEQKTQLDPTRIYRNQNDSRAVSSTYAASSIALGRAAPRADTLVPERIKSIDEIIGNHSSRLVPPRTDKLPLRSTSWSAFDSAPARDLAHERLRNRSTSRRSSTASSEGSIDSVEREVQASLRSASLLSLHTGESSSKASIPAGQDRDAEISGNNEQYDPKRYLTNTESDEAARYVPFQRPRQMEVQRPQAESAEQPMQKRLNRFVQVQTAGQRSFYVSFADVGDQQGHPVMVYLGLGAVRHLIGLYDEIATTFGLRLICIDRWGVGRTEAVPFENRSVLGWSAVVGDIADRLGVERYSILAHSAGAPFAVGTSLIHPDKVVGPLQLLAPWTGIHADSGYRWLRFVPDGFIKTAQLAEWRIQAWRLGKTEGKDPARAGLPNPNERLDSGPRSAMDASTETRSALESKKPKSYRLGSLFGAKQVSESTSRENGVVDAVHRQQSSDNKENVLRDGNATAATRPATSQAPLRQGCSETPLFALGHEFPLTTQLESLRLDKSLPSTPGSDAPSSPSWVDSGKQDSASILGQDHETQSKVEQASEYALDLLRASHAESSRGSTEDLNLVLGKKPWGFEFKDLDLPCVVWHGSKDERISPANSRSLSKDMASCSLRIIEGAGHNLMTNSEVIVEVFENIKASIES